MSFQPVLPLQGFVGWRFLQKTLATQQAAHATTPSIRRDEAYFRETVASVGSAAALVEDTRLLRVALTAFGLADDLPHRAYVRKVLESSTLEPGSFVNRLTDSRYRQLAAAFGFGDSPVPNTMRPGFADQIIDGFRERSFEVAVGAGDESMRLALALGRDLQRLAGQASSEATKWYTVLGTPSLRAVFETAFNLPQAFGALDIDRQTDILRARTLRLTGSDSVTQFTDPDAIAVLTRRFFLAGDVARVQVGSGQSNALALLQTGQASLRGLLGR